MTFLNAVAERLTGWPADDRAQRRVEWEAAVARREIHDELGGALTGLRMDVTRLAKNLNTPAAADQPLAPPPPPFQRRLGDRPPAV